MNRKAIQISDRLLTIVIFALYPLILAYIFLSEFGVFENKLTLNVALFIKGGPIIEDIFIPAVVIPLTGFIFCTFLRNIINRKRPFAVYGEEPLIERKNDGKSFPSRHAFSAFVIGFTILFLSIVMEMMIGILLSIVMLILGAIISYLRVIAKVHYPSDVICGASFGAMWAVVGLIVYYYLI